MNKYELGRKLSLDERADVVHYRQKYGHYGHQDPEAYWSVIGRNLVHEASQVQHRIAEAYGCPELAFTIPIMSTWFVTDDTDLFLEMYKVLGLDFVADFKSGLFFLDLYAAHTLLREALYGLTERARRQPDNLRSCEYDKYIEEGHGMFKSSQSNIVWIGEDVAVPEYFSRYRGALERM